MFGPKLIKIEYRSDFRSMSAGNWKQTRINNVPLNQLMLVILTPL